MSDCQQYSNYPGELRELKLQDTVIQYLESKGWDVHKQEYEIMPGFSQYGKGDLVFIKKQSVLVIETKYIDSQDSRFRTSENTRTRRTKRTKNRKKVKEQALFYAALLRTFKAYAQYDEVIAATYTNEKGLETIKGFEKNKGDARIVLKNNKTFMRYLREDKKFRSWLSTVI